MNRMKLGVICAAVVLCLLAAAPAAADYPPPPQAPSYLLLRGPRVQELQATHGRYPGMGYHVRSQAYSYGWFGAGRRRHKDVQHGYGNGYTQWTFR